MKFQISTDYAIRILQYLHMVQTEGDPLQTAMTISHATGLTYPFFIKLANQMKKHGLVDAVQGRNGGYVLGKPAGEISVYDVVVATDGEMKLNRCLNNKEDVPCTKGAKEHCGLRKFFGGVQESVIEKLKAQSIADLNGFQSNNITRKAACQ